MICSKLSGKWCIWDLGVVCLTPEAASDPGSHRLPSTCVDWLHHGTLLLKALSYFHALQIDSDGAKTKPLMEMAFHAVVWGWKETDCLVCCSPFHVSLKTSVRVNPTGLHLMQDALHKAYVSHNTTQGPQSLDHSCRGAEMKWIAGRGWRVTFWPTKLQHVSPHIGFVHVFFLASKLFRTDSESYYYC